MNWKRRYWSHVTLIRSTKWRNHVINCHVWLMVAYIWILSIMLAYCHISRCRPLMVSSIYITSFSSTMTSSYVLSSLSNWLHDVILAHNNVVSFFKQTWLPSGALYLTWSCSSINFPIISCSRKRNFQLKTADVSTNHHRHWYPVIRKSRTDSFQTLWLVLFVVCSLQPWVFAVRTYSHCL